MFEIDSDENLSTALDNVRQLAESQPSAYSRRQFVQALSGAVTAGVAPWLPAFQDVAEGQAFTALPVEGTLPSELQGTLYRAGPMRFASPDGQPYGHWFDGDGGIIGFRLDGQGGAQAAVRVVQSAGLQKELAKGKRLYPGYGSGSKRALWKIMTNQFKNVANTNVISWQDELWALVESHGPTRIDPDTLGTLGTTNLDGALRGGFSAHPHLIAGDPRMINTGVQFGMTTKLFLYELQPGKNARRLLQVPKPHCMMMHDFALTKRHAVLLQPPLSVDLPAVLKHKGAVSKGIRWQPERGTEIFIVPLAEPHRYRRFTVDPFYQWHVGNAWENGDDIMVDIVAYPDFQSNEALAIIPTGKPNQGGLNGQLTRLRISPQRETVQKTKLLDAFCEFPQVNPQFFGHQHRLVVVASFSDAAAARQGMQDRLSLVDAESGQSKTISFGEQTYTGEALLVPKKTKQDKYNAWILAVYYDVASHRSALAVLDADHFADGPVARAWFPGPLPFTFHGHWQAKI